jgi:predicted DNA-binding transcriptional regulator AlpA
MTNQPRLIGRKDAAAYCGIAESTFSLWVAKYKMPPAVPGTRRWDKRAIDARLDEISGLGASDKHSGETDLQKWRRERDERRRSGK